MSPSFSSAGGPLPPHLTTGDSVRDKCIEMLAAALRTDSKAQITLYQLEHTLLQLMFSKDTDKVTHTKQTKEWNYTIQRTHTCHCYVQVNMIFFLVFTDDFKDFGTNCESMAAEIEDHILEFSSLFADVVGLTFSDTNRSYPI